MIKTILAAAALVALSMPALAETCYETGDTAHATLTGEIVQSVTTQPNDGTGEPAGVKYFAIVLDKPICFKSDPIDMETIIRADPVSKKWLGHHVIIVGNLTLDEELIIIVQRIKDTQPAQAATKDDADCGGPILQLKSERCLAQIRGPTIPCKKVLSAARQDKGWARAARLGSSTLIADAVDRLKNNAAADLLGFGSVCHLGSLIEAQCKLTPNASLFQVTDSLLDKAKGGKPLPDTPACGQ